MKKLQIAGLIFLIISGAGCSVAPTKPSTQPYEQKLAEDSKAVQVYRAGIARLVDFAEKHTELFPSKKPDNAHLLSEQDRSTVRDLWAEMLDYYVALDAISDFYTGNYLTSDNKSAAFYLGYSAFLTQYRFALEFIKQVENDPNLAILLNDSMPGSGTPINSYDQFKFRFLNVVPASQFAAYQAIAKTMPEFSDPMLASALVEDTAYIWQMGKGKGEMMTLANAGNVLGKIGFHLFFPVQAGVSEWMGDTKIWRLHKELISAKQIADLHNQLQPGDVMLERREWYVSNIGLPGFWSHAALYIGTAEERKSYFQDAAVKRWVIEQGENSGDFEALLQHSYSAAYATSLKPLEHDHLPRVLEAISEGVSFTSIEHSAGADSIAVLRPRLTKVEKARALWRAFSYSGYPYDFNFDFQTDSALVCTELVYKAYEPDTQFPGIRLQLEEIVGRTAIPANSIAKQFDAEFGTIKQQFDLIAFLDGQEKSGVAIPESLKTFRHSWQRPKWHVFVQKPTNPA